jgi:hypothetical protein
MLKPQRGLSPPRQVVAETSEPLAETAEPLAVASGPLAVASGPLAVASGPFAVASGPLAVASGPLAVASGPLAVDVDSPEGVSTPQAVLRMEFCCAKLRRYAWLIVGYNPPEFCATRKTPCSNPQRGFEPSTAGGSLRKLIDKR